MRISDWSSDVCSSDLLLPHRLLRSHAVTCCLGLHPLSERAHPRIDEPFLAIDQVVALACRHAEIEGIDERPGGDLRVDVAGVAQEEAVTAYRCGHRPRVVDKAQFAPRLEAGKAGPLPPPDPEHETPPCRE